MKTLADYINFLRKHKYSQEAYFFQTDVVNILSKSLNLDEEDVLKLPAKDIPKKLEMIVNTLQFQVNQLKPKEQWDVEVCQQE